MLCGVHNVFLWFANKFVPANLQMGFCLGRKCFLFCFGCLFCVWVFVAVCSFVLENWLSMYILLIGNRRNLQLTTSQLWNESSLKWVRTWAKKPNAMLFLHCLFFQGHAGEWPIIQIIKLKVVWLTNYRAVRRNEPCHNFSESSFHARKQVTYGIFVHQCCWALSKCLLKNIKQEIDATGQVFVLPIPSHKNKYRFAVARLASCSVLLLIRFHTRRKKKIRSLFQFRACWKWLKCINKKVSLVRALKYSIKCFIKITKFQG